MNRKLRAHLIVLPRWFALPCFGVVSLIGSVLAGGTLSQLNTWLGFIIVTLAMWSGHAQNTFWDWKAGLDDGEDRSVEKEYSAGCEVISGGLLKPGEVVTNFVILGILSIVVSVILSFRVGWPVIVPVVLGLAIPYFYTRGKFSWYHEAALAAGVVLATVGGMLAINPAAAWWQGVLVGLIPAIILSFLGLPLDEYPDASHNLKKGVHSLPYQIWANDFSLSLFLLTWVCILYSFQMFLIFIDILKPMTAISFALVPFFMYKIVTVQAAADILKQFTDNPISLPVFNKHAKILVVFGMLWPILLLIGQVI